MRERFVLLTGGSRRRCHGSAPSRPRSIGATTCSARPSKHCSGAFPCSPAAGRSDGVEAVCAGDGLEVVEILDLLSSLVDSRWCRSRSRSSRLATRCWRRSVRTRGRSSATPPRRAVRDQHLEYHLRLAESAEPDVRGGWRVAQPLTTRARQLPRRARRGGRDAGRVEASPTSPLRCGRSSRLWPLARGRGRLESALAGRVRAGSLGQRRLSLWATSGHPQIKTTDSAGIAMDSHYGRRSTFSPRILSSTRHVSGPSCRVPRSSTRFCRNAASTP